MVFLIYKKKIDIRRMADLVMVDIFKSDVIQE